MQTFKGTVSLDFKAVVPSTFLQECRDIAAGDNPSPFLLAVQKQHPVNDDAFIAAVLSNGVRRTLRNSLADLLHTSGMGGTVAPASITITEAVREHDAPPAVAQVIKVERKEPPPPVALHGQDTAPHAFLNTEVQG